MSILRNDDGTYRLNWVDMLAGSSIRRLDDAWVPVPAPVSASSPNSSRQDERSFGWVRAGSSAPFKDDRYIVEFVGRQSFRILAYMDRFGRVFSTGETLIAPPAREPDLAFARFGDVKMPPHDEAGCVQIRVSGGGVRQVAQYRRENGCYRLFDTWYVFGDRANGLSYADTLTRCYLAFVFRCAEGARSVPTRGFATMKAALRENNPLDGFRAIVEEVREARFDPALEPPALLACLADWLVDAGLERISSAVRNQSGEKAVPLRLVRTSRYADTYYVGIEDEEAAKPLVAQDVWALEAALNRFLLAGERFSDRAATASAAECREMDAELFATIAQQVADAGHTLDEGGDPAGEWDVRKSIGEAIERLRLPVRCFPLFKADVDSGFVAFDVTMPNASLIPDEALALRYAQHIGILLAAAAFRSSRLIIAVLVRACPLKVDSAVGASDASIEAPFYRVLFDRELFCENDAYRSAAAGDPAPLFAAHGARYGLQAQRDPFDLMDQMGSSRARRDAPEGMTGRFGAATEGALGARTTHDLRIYYEGIVRHVGENLSSYVVGSKSATEAIRFVRRSQEDADDPLVYEACTRLMTALVEGTVDATDQNEVVTCFIGEDRYHRALMEARAIAPHDAAAAISILRTVIAEVESCGRFADNAETVYRVFDSYASRVVYNLDRPEVDRGKRVELAPVSLLLCYMDAVKLLSESFEHADEALRLGLRTMEMAPTFSIAFRQTARACMLMGDLDNASRILKKCLEFAVQADEIAIAYYQLAYVEWKAGRPLVGAACYLKSIMTSSVYAAQSTVELQELLGEVDFDAPAKDVVDFTLAAGDVPVAPSSELLGKLDTAAAAAVDANVFSVARSLLSARLRHRPDDALANVLRSL